MIDLFDTLGNTLNDMIGSHDNNSVSWMWDQMYSPKGYDEGGLVMPDGSASDDTNVLSAIGKAASKTFSSANGVGAFNNSNPVYEAMKYSQAGKFFGGGEPGSKYTDHFDKGAQSKPAQATDPNEFLARWNMAMRRFAEAKELSDAGQVITRSR